MTTIDELIERCRKAEGPDRELDEAFWLMFDPNAPEAHAANKVPLPWLWRVTDSLDCITTLIEKELGDLWFSILLDAMRDFGVQGTLPPSQLARFVCLHFLLAIQSKDTSDAK